MSFTLTKLAGSGTLVEGTDTRGNYGQALLDSSQWDEIKRHDLHQEAVASIDDAIAALVAPITEAIESARSKVAAPELDPLLYVVEQEGEDHVPGAPRIVSKLNPDSVVLRAIEEGADDRLLWLNDRLVLAAEPVRPATTPAEAGEPAEA